MEIIPDKRKVVGLVEQAREGKICLPNFQRDFVWTREEVCDLVRSIVRGYFIGSLLLLRCDPARPPFAPLFLRGSSSAYKDPKPELLILDGQQRLSSLMYALTAPDLSLKDSSQRRWFFLDLDLLLEDPDNDEIVFDRAKRELRGLDAPDVQFEQHILPCTALLQSQLFYSWRDAFEDWLRENHPDQLDGYRHEWRDKWTEAVAGFQSFEVPLVELPLVDEADGDAIGRVCAIFEKLNSTGVELSVYDLLTARLYRSGIKLHDLWDESCREHSRLRTWSGGKADKNKFGVLVLRTLALLRGLDPKPKILIDLSPEQFEEDWRRAAAAMDRALELITHVGPDGFGVFDAKWLPGFGLVPVLAALRAELETHKLGDEARSELRHWYWSNVFTERYSSAIESKSRKDYAEMTAHWFESAPEPAVISEARESIGAPSYRIRSSASYASALYSGVFCLLALRGARDWRLGEAIQLQELQDHHIFPRAYLTRHRLTKRAEVNTIANRTLISNGTNAKIRDKAPATYVDDEEVFPGGATDALLEPHFLGRSVLVLMEAGTEELSDEAAAALYEQFIRAREQAIIGEIRRACGIEAAAVGSVALEQPEAEDVAPDVLDEEVVEEDLLEPALD
jgi:hypothetical protein